MSGFRIVGLRVYEGDDAELAKRGASIIQTGYQATTDLPEYRLTFDEEDQDAA